MNYKVSDIFQSLQGEGYWAGRSAVFIRLHGCNLTCSFCDEKLHKERYQNFDIDKLIATVKKYHTDFVVITGGEPSIRDCNPLIDALHEIGKFVAVETNGFDFENMSSADWVTYSPKNWKEIVLHGWDEIKFVVNEKTDITPILDIVENSLIWLQPEADMDKVIQSSVNKCVETIKRFPHLRLSLQTHKLIGIK